MNIEYTEQDIRKLRSIQTQIHAQTLISRDAGDKVLELLQELRNEQVRIAARFHESKVKP